MTMTPDERERARLRYILESIARIEQYARGDQQTFQAEPIVQDAVLRRLETLADATDKLSTTLKARHPEIPWREVYGFRNITARISAAIERDSSRGKASVEALLDSVCHHRS